MTITEWANYFDLLQDKSGSPYFVPDEMTAFFNAAITEFVKNKLPDEDKGINLELSQDTLNDLEPLIFTTTPFLISGGSQYLLKSALQTQLVSSTAAPVWRVLSIGWTMGQNKKPVKFVRHNDWWEFQQNFFKKPSYDNPKFKIEATRYVFDPAPGAAKLEITVLVYPTVVDVTGAIDCNLPEHTHYKIVAIALELAGISSRDEALAQLLQLKKNG